MHSQQNTPAPARRSRLTHILLAVLALALATVLALSLAAQGSGPAQAIGRHGPGHGPGHGHGHVPAKASAGCGSEQKPGNDQMTIKSGGKDRTSRINIPRSYDVETPEPLILGFHGNGSDGAEFQNFTGIPGLPAVSVFPDGVEKDGKRSWQGAPYASGADDVKFVADLLDHVEKNYCVDLNRVYATGKSNGGGLVSLLACRLADRFSAFAITAGAYYPQSTAGCGYSKPTSVLAIHGTGDETMHYDGGYRQGETYPSVRDWIKPWAKAARCGRAAERQVGKHGEGVTRTAWRHCAGATDVELYSVRGGGHVWPGEQMYSGGGFAAKHFSATKTAWRFFQDHPRRAKA